MSSIWWQALPTILVVLGTVVLSQVVLNVLVRRLHRWQQSGAPAAKIDQTMMQIMTTVIKVVIWTLAGLVILQNVGVNISALLGGVGVAGIAISFALQNVLSDILSFFSIYLDKPFQVGDFIVIGQESGTVEKIGLKSTRIKTLQGQELIVANSELTTTQINNYRQLQQRRVQLEFLVSHQTTHQTLAVIPELITQACSDVDQLEFGRAHLKQVTPTGFLFEVVFVVMSSDYQLYMDLQQRVLLTTLALFKKHKVTLATAVLPSTDEGTA